MTTILDRNGQPFESGALSQEVAQGSITTIRNPFDDLVATGVTPQDLVAFLRAAGNRDHDNYIQYAAEMERRDPHYYSVLGTRKLALIGLDRAVVPPDESPGEAQIAEDLTNMINRRGFSTILMNVLDALGKGFSMNEIVWDTSETPWRPQAIKWRNQRFFRTDIETGEEWFLRTDKLSDPGEPLQRYKFIVHQPCLMAGLPLAGGLARVCAAMHLFKSFSIKSWMAFGEVFGMPIRIGKYPPNALPADVATLRDALRDIGSDAGAVIPSNMEIMLERAASSGNAGADEFFKTQSEFFNSEISKAVLGQTMTSDDGSSLAQAKVHNEVRIDIRNADAVSLEETLNRDLIIPYIDLNFGPRPHESDYPRVQFDTSEQEDLVSLMTALTPFIDRGLTVSQAEIRDKFNLKEPEAGEELLSALGALTAEDDDATDNTVNDANMRQAGKLRKVLDTIDQHTNMRSFKRSVTEILNE